MKRLLGMIRRFKIGKVSAFSSCEQEFWCVTNPLQAREKQEEILKAWWHLPMLQGALMLGHWKYRTFPHLGEY
jgi:hypothetical protein